MSAATVIADAFGEGACLYKNVLEVESDATQAQLRKAYYRKALLFHPDKSTGMETKFRAVSVAYEILKDPEKRAEYDETGELVDDDDGETSSTKAWVSYFHQIFGKVTTSKIDKFAQSYKCSTEEEADVLKEYTKYKGNLKKMLDCVMLSEARDVERWVQDYIQPAIDNGDVQDYSKTLHKTLKQVMASVVDEEEEIDEDETESDESHHETKPSVQKKKKQKRASKQSMKRKRKQEQEAQAAEELMAKIRGKNNAVTKRNSKTGFDTALSGIAARYGVTDNVDDDPLADEDFEKLQAKMLGRKKARK